MMAMGTRVIAVMLAGLLTLGLAVPAGASDDRGRREGSCSGGPSEWKLVVRRESASTLRIRYEIEGGKAGQTWQLFISDNGTRIYAGNKVSGAGGYVRVRRETADRSGTDLIKATGVNLDSGESCSGSLSF